MTYSAPIDRAVSVAEEAGNRVVEISTGWSAMREVVEMRDPLTKALRSEIRKIEGLREYSYPGSPHNQADAGFVDDAKKVAISFPLGNAEMPSRYRSWISIPAVVIVVVLGALIAAMFHIHIG